MFGDSNNARLIAIVAIFVGLSVCAACLLMTLVFTSVYGGQTVALRNPFAAPTAVVSNNTGSGSSGAGTSGNTGNAGGNTSGADAVESPGSTGGSTGSSAPSNSSGGSVGVPSGSSAANYLPTLPGYTTADASSIQGAINLISGAGGFSAQSANDDTFNAQSLSGIATAVIVSRVDDFIACYRNVGAVEAQVYIQADLVGIVSGEVPPLGAVAVVNQDLLRDNIVSCAVSPNDPNTFSAQAANEPCGNFGSFTRDGDTFTYIYAGTSQSFCNQVDGYYTRLGG